MDGGGTKTTKTTGSRRQVINGTAKKTVGALAKGDLKRNKQGRIVSKKASEAGKTSFKNIKTWQQMVMEQYRKLTGKDRLKRAMKITKPLYAAYKRSLGKR